MTPNQMISKLLDNVDRARGAMEDGATGFVLHTSDHVHILCQRGDAAVRLGDPLDDDIVVLASIGRALVMQRYWNSIHTDTFNTVTISLRREALGAYIDLQQRAVEVLTNMGAAA